MFCRIRCADDAADDALVLVIPVILTPHRGAVEAATAALGDRD